MTLTLENIINEFDQKVQAYKDTDDNYEVFIKMLLGEYVDRIDGLPDLLEGIDPNFHPYIIPFQRNLVKNIKTLAEGIIQTTVYYFSKSSIDGNAYKAFVDTILPIEKKIKKWNLQTTTNFYRLRPIKTKSTVLTRKELFHIDRKSVV